jgi:chaperonin cofactor prefoldin
MMDRKDRIEIMFEKMQGDIKLVLEGHAALNNKIEAGFEELNGKVDGLDMRVGGLENKVAGLDMKVGGLEKSVGGLDKRVGSLEFQVKTLNTSMDILNHEVKELNANVEKHISLPAHLAHAS